MQRIPERKLHVWETPMANSFETPDFVHFLRIAALIDAAANGIGRWRLIVHVPPPPTNKIMQAKAALDAACELAAHAMRELEELDIDGLLHSRALSWHAEGDRIREMVQGLLSDPLPEK